MIPYSRQDISQEDIDSVAHVLKSDFLTQGEMVPKFENAISNKVGVNHSICVNSATSALHIACLALGLGKGDTLWTSPNTFVASANCALYCGAQVDFVDIDLATHNMSADALLDKLKNIKSQDQIPKIVVPVSFSGRSSDMKKIYNLSKKYNFKVIEDASHSIGGKYYSEMIGSCRYSDITVFSFHPVKIITSGEGGMALTNKSDLAKKMMLLRTHGITRNKEELLNNSQDPWYYEQLTLGFNYRMSDLHAALGFSQLKRLDFFVQKRQEIAKYYDRALKDLPIILPKESLDSAYHLYVIQIDNRKTSITRSRLFEYMRSKGIGVNVHYIPVHTHPFYKKKGFKEGDFPNSEKFYQNAISLPIFPSIDKKQLKMVVLSLEEILS